MQCTGGWRRKVIEREGEADNERRMKYKKGNGSKNLVDVSGKVMVMDNGMA